MMLLFAIIAGFILDLLIGDPRWLPHPICLIGNLISFLENLLRSIFGKSSRGLLVGGAVLVILVLAFSFCVPFLVLACRKNQSVACFCGREFYVLSNFCNALFT